MTSSGGRKPDVFVRLIEALQRRVEDNDAMEDGHCDCVWCVEDRELLREAKTKLATDEGVFV